MQRFRYRSEEENKRRIFMDGCNVIVRLVDGEDVIASERLPKSLFLWLKLRGKRFEERRGGESVEVRMSSVLEAAVPEDSAGAEGGGRQSWTVAGRIHDIPIVGKLCERIMTEAETTIRNLQYLIAL